jgi:DNA-binding CsgD family transcriptional regulator
MLYGRAVERSVIDLLIADAIAGSSGVLVVRGEPGIGKTALLDYAAAAAAPVVPGSAAFRVVRGEGVECKAELPFEGLRMLLGPVLDRLGALPEPQQDALGGALGLRDSGSHDRFLIGLAVLSLLAEIAEDGPVLCLVDDAHWLDQASTDALVFAARRLDAEGVAVIFAVRDHGEASFVATGLIELQLQGLDAASAAMLLTEHGGAKLPPGTRDRILAEAQGNPLALIELPAAYQNAPAAARLGDTGPALTDRLQERFGGQVRRLPEATQALLVVAAALDGNDLAVMLEAAAGVGATVADLEPAERAGLVRLSGSTLTFRHPLVRSAAYYGATPGQRVAAHRALADALREPTDADRRAWHLAAAATGPDEAVAAELERTAAGAAARSGYAAAAAAYEQAVELTADPAARARRLALAAVAATETGEFDRARALATRATDQITDPAARAVLTSVLALADFGQGRLQTAHKLLVNGAQISGVDPARAAKFLMNAVHVAWFLGDQALMADTAGRFKAVAESVAAPYVPLIALMLASTAQAAEQPPPEDSPPLATLVAQARRCRAGDRDDLAMIAMASLVAGQNSEARELSGQLVDEARAEGRIGWLPATANCLAQALVFDGWHRDALATVTDALRIAQDIAQSQWIEEANAITAYLAAVAGDEERCRQLAHAALTEPAGHLTSAARPWARWALGVLHLGQGRPKPALDYLETVTEVPSYHYGSALRSVPDLVEAAVRLGQPERAAEPLARFTAWARRADTPNTDALAERCRALLTSGKNAERHYLAALKLHELSFEQARTQLLYGVWLRRTRRQTEARTHLRAALDHLQRIGAAPWVRLARAELTATGATGPRPGRADSAPLTPQELQIARLAAQGLSNRDIAAHLFLSPRTVAYHLYKAYSKLGITSRAEIDLDDLGT